MPATTWGHVSQSGLSATKHTASPRMWTIGEHLRSSSGAFHFAGVLHVRHGTGPRHVWVHALTVVTIMQAVISASFAVAKLRSGAQSDVDGTKRRDQRPELKQPPPPQSLAPWHTLPYMGREVRGCNNPSQGAKLSSFWDLFTARISIYAGTLPGWRVEAQGRQQTCACTAKVCLICIALAICFQMYDLPNCSCNM